VLAAGLVFLTSCAVVEPPPGGPEDVDPPYVTFVYPDSGTTGLQDVKKLRVVFSEKMDRQSATTWLHFFPDQRIRKTKWKGSTSAEIELEEPLPADTLIVVEISAGLRDAHKVKSRTGRRYPLATGDTIATGTLSGVLLLEDAPVTTGVVELYGLQPDTLEFFQRPLIRRTVTNETGAYRFDWLPVPGGPWVARAFSNKDGSLRPGERDPQRLVPDTLRVSVDQPDGVVGITTLYTYDTPGRLSTGPFAAAPYPGQVMAFTLQISDADTGYVAVPASPRQHPMSVLLPDTGGVVTKVKPGLNRLIAFVDVDADSTFGSVPDTLLGVAVAALTDTLSWYLEPWTILEGLQVEPGLETAFVMPAWTDSLTIMPAPVPREAPADTMAVGPADSLATMPPDSLELESLEDPEN
jgi:hypothetical protein